MKPGDPVVYLPDPLLYGEMEIAHIRKGDGRLVCIIAPDSLRPTFEVFDVDEVGVPESAVA